MTGEMFENEFDLDGEDNDALFEVYSDDDSYLPDEYEPWFGEMLTELDEILLDEEFLLD